VVGGAGVCSVILLSDVVVLTVFPRNPVSKKRGELGIVIDPLRLLSLSTLLNLRSED